MVVTLKINLDAPKISMNRWTLAPVQAPLKQQTGDSLSFSRDIYASIHNGKKMIKTWLYIISWIENKNVVYLHNVRTFFCHNNFHM